MIKKLFTTLCGIVVLFASSPQVQAHTFGAEGAGFVEGFVHPFSGPDHLLAMLAIGIWAAQRGQSALWKIPTAFIGAMVLAAFIAAYGFDMPLLELAIAMTVVLAGALLTFSIRLPMAISMMIAALFAMTHGYAHGLEIPETASAMSYGVGFVLATSLLHLVGIVIALSIRSHIWLTRTGGLAITAAGFYLAGTAI